jgi:hypothetical protein
MIARLALSAAAAVLLSGCVSLTRTSAPQAACSADELTDYVGKVATARLGEEIMQASGAKSLQWLQPGQAATMDFQPTRLRVKVDAENKVLSASCG